MSSVLCALPLALVGLAIALASCWWYLVRAGGLRWPGDFRRQVAPAILWLTSECEQALGNRARPGRLRRASDRCLAQLLCAHQFPPGELAPTVDRYSTWREQAELLCAGQYEALRRWQDKLLAGDDAPEAGPRHLAWLIACLLALLLALVLFLASPWPGCGCPACVDREITPVVDEVVPANTTGPVDPGVEEVDYAINIDLFEFNRDRPYSDEHVAQFNQALERLFSAYEGIEITGISAHTDPIGGDTSNRGLAERRGEFVRARILDLANSESLRGRFKQPMNIQSSVVQAQGPSTEDHRFWRACFSTYYLAHPEAPSLGDLDPRLAGGRRTCSAGDEAEGATSSYPACRRLMVQDARGSTLPAFAERAERFRELAACLAPMRHVIVQFKYTRARPVAAGTTR